MKIEMNLERQMIITPETRLDEMALEALLDRWSERSLTAGVVPVNTYAPIGSKYIVPTAATDPLGLRSATANSAGSQEDARR